MQVGDITNPDAAANGKPLDGVRVLAIEQMQSLPYATQLLARMGAEVIKVEHPTRGDLGRSSLPAVTDASGAQMGATFLRNNLSKRSIALDLKSPRAQDIVRRLAPRFDVVAENFKAGTMDRFGLGYADLAEVAPKLIYLSVSGFGNLVDSPYGHWPAFAPIAEAMSGLYTFNRGPDDELKVSPMGALGDTGTGVFAVVGVLAALRHRDRTGVGQYVDVSMFDAMVAFADIVPNYASMGKDPRTPSALINHGFPIAAGEVVVQVGREPQFAVLADLVGHPEWVDDPRFATRDGWVRHIDVLRSGVAAWAGDRTTIEVAEALADAGIAAAPVFEAADVIADPHVAARDMLVAIPTPDGEDVLTAGNPVKLSAMSEGPDTAPPTLGQDTDEVLRTELGLDDAELEQLRSDGVIG
ncbi:MAG: CaiB/BaiF CoA transferase family protein [Acidimicrobiales bacterium]